MSSFTLYNTMTRRKEPFAPLDPPFVRMYCCGLTVYNYAHIGNLRTYIFEDVLRRTLKFNGFNVKHVMNITDVEDRIIKFSREAGVPIDEYTAKYIDGLWQDFDDLGMARRRAPHQRVLSLPRFHSGHVASVIE